jgi:hypothetical protein
VLKGRFADLVKLGHIEVGLQCSRGPRVLAAATGDVQLLDCLVVEDVGRIVNPLTLHCQAIGGVVQGLGGAFLEHPRL